MSVPCAHDNDYYHHHQQSFDGFFILYYFIMFGGRVIDVIIRYTAAVLSEVLAMF